MKKYFLSLITFSILFTTSISAQKWDKDILEDGYEYRYVNHPDDYSGKVRSTIIRKKSDCADGKAVLYVHGYNDYFFQKEMGNRFVDSCYNFYAVDLRKYGRSLMEGQRKFEVHDMTEYFADIDSAVVNILNEGNKSITLMGHSTGGLTTSYYMAQGRGDRYPINGLILNSPFLDMNLSKFQENVLVPVVTWYSYLSKNTNIPQGDSMTYAESLLKEYHGEWEYNTDWKMKVSPDVTSGWIGAIHNSQKYMQKGTDIKVPILLMHSKKSVDGDIWTPEFNKADAVLDVNDIEKYGTKLGRDILELKVEDGLHDIMLSRKPVRNAVYDRMFLWMNQKGM